MCGIVSPSDQYEGLAHKRTPGLHAEVPTLPRDLQIDGRHVSEGSSFSRHVSGALLK